MFFENSGFVKLPFPDELSPRLRNVGRAVLGPHTRQRLATSLERLAHVQSFGSSEWRRSRSRIKSLKNRHRGETCVIVGNGPSLKDQDLRELSFAKTFCLNRGYLIWRDQGVQPDYFVCVNDLVIEQFNDDILTFNFPCFLPWRHRHLFAAADNAVFLEMRWQERFFQDVTAGVWPGANVTAATLQIAFHMGFKTVILVGVDHRYRATGPANLEVIQQEDDQCHFSSSYFAKGTRWNLPDLEKSEVAYRLAKQAYEADGRQVIDATQDGALTVFPKMTLAEAARHGRAHSAAAQG